MPNCASILNGFREMTESLNAELLRRASISNVWITAVNRSTFPKGRGQTQETVTVANSEPTNDTPTWQAEAGYSPSNTEGHCALSRTDVVWGLNVRNYTPEKAGLRGPLVCSDELTYDFAVDTLVTAYVEEIKKYAVRYWTNRLREHYISYSNKAVATTAFPITTGTALAATASQATLPTTAATSELTRDMLDRIAMELIYAGAGDPDSNGYVSLGPDGPVFTLLIHPEMIQKLLLDNPEIRQDYRWAAPSELLKGLGVSRRFYNFQLLPDLLPARYNYTAGAYVRVNAFTQTAASSRGYQSDVSAAYKAAEYETAIVIHPKAIEIEFVAPKSTAGPLTFDPKNWMMEWTWVTGGFRLGLDPVTCPDPTEKYGQHIAEIRWAIKPLFPQYAYTIFYRRCQNTVDTVSCDS